MNTNKLKCKGHILEDMPIINVSMENNYKLQYLALVSRLEHPENFTKEENINETILYLISWLKEQRTNYQHSEDFIDILVEYEKYVGYDIIDTTILRGCYFMFTDLRKAG